MRGPKYVVGTTKYNIIEGKVKEPKRLVWCDLKPAFQTTAARNMPTVEVLNHVLKFIGYDIPLPVFFQPSPGA